MNDLNVVIVENQGKIGQRAAGSIAHFLVTYYKSLPPEERAEVDRRAEQLRQKRETEEPA